LLGVRGKPRMYRSLWLIVPPVFLNVPTPRHQMLSHLPTRSALQRRNLELLTFQLSPLVPPRLPTHSALWRQRPELLLLWVWIDRFILPRTPTSRCLGNFYMPQIYDMGPRVYFPSEGRRAWRFLPPLKIRRLRPVLNPRTWVPEARDCCCNIGSSRMHEFKCFNFSKIRSVWLMQSSVPH
jgi:hypothetical protein